MIQKLTLQVLDTYGMEIIKRTTDEFENGCVYDENAVTMIYSADELVKVIKNNAMGHYKLANDIDFNQLSIEDRNYITQTFLALFDGNGYHLKNVNATLLVDIQYATIENVYANVIKS